MQVRFLTEGTNGQFSQEMPHFCKFSVLGLKFFRQFVTLDHGRVFKLHIPQSPFSPTLSWVHNRIVEFLLGSSHKIFHIFLRDPLLQCLQNDLKVHKTIFVLICNVIVLEWTFRFRYLKISYNFLSALIIPLQNGIVQGGESGRTDHICVAALSKQILDHLYLIPLGSSHQRSLSRLSSVVDVGLEPLYKNFGNVQVPIESNPMQRCGFVVNCQITIDELWLLFQQFTDFRQVLLLDVPEKILICCIAVRDALDCTHISQCQFSIITFKFSGFHLKLEFMLFQRQQNCIEQYYMKNRSIQKKFF